MPTIEPDAVSRQIQEGQVPDAWLALRPPQYPRWLIALFGVLFLVLIPPLCTAYFALMFWTFGPQSLVQTSFWPMYAAYPYLALIALALPFFLTWLVWWLEKRERDRLLVLLPEGFILYVPWSDERRRRAKVVAYSEVEEIESWKKSAKMQLDIRYRNGEREKLLLSWKYNGALPIPDLYREIPLRIIDDLERFIEREKSHSNVG